MRPGISNSVLAGVLLLATSAMAAPPAPATRRSQPTYESTFFEHSLLDASRTQARAALRRNPRSVDALFVEMEAAALEADTPAVLDAALRMLAVSSAQHDERAAIAAGRVHDLAANTQEFIRVLPRLRALLARPNSQAEVLRLALVKAGMDGLRAVNVAAEAKSAGLLTDWRAAGPFGEYANLDFNRAWPPQRDLLMGEASDGRRIELFHYSDGVFHLPAYFANDGVFYAMSQTDTAAGAYEIRVESAGTLEVFVDGKPVLRHDSRFRVIPEITSAAVRLGRGTHTVLVKFLSSAQPFRVAVTRGRAARLDAVASNPIEAQYVAASRKFWEGDYAGAVGAFEQLRAAHESAAVDWMLYQSWVRAEKDSPEAASLLNTVLRLTPEALAADYELAARDNAAGRFDDALDHLSRVLGKRAYFAPAEDLMGSIAVRMHLPVRASGAIEILLDIHPSCDVLRRAQHFFAGHARYDRARQVDEALSDCAIDSIAYATSLSESGKHQESAAAVQKVIARNPLDREAREMLARELALAGDTAGARSAIQELARIAPNAERFQRMAADANLDPLTLLDNASTVIAASDSKPFYAPYRRDGVTVVKAAADRHFSGGPALLLLDDQIAQQWPDGSVSLYVHRITRALDRGGVELYGEVSVPHGAEVLELRTIRSDGSVLEPELTPEKATISMPGLLPGDCVDEEYVFHYKAAEASSTFVHRFGSFRAPILASRFVVLTPSADREWVQASATAPAMTESLDGGVHVRSWEMKNIPQAVEETASAHGDILPTVRVTPALQRGWEDVRDDMREVAVNAERIGPRVTAAVDGLKAGSDDELARTLYRQVTTTLRSSTAEFDFDTPTAEQTLLNRAGSRTAALLAMANAVGLDADLVLTREVGVVNAGDDPGFGVYTRPLVRFHLRDSLGVHDVTVDAETDGLPFGMLPPSIDRREALLVTLPDDRKDAKVEPAILRLPARSERDQSVARADVTIGANGDISADITILVGAWRGVQMRETLADSGEGRDHFFTRLARRIFPGAENVTGDVRNQDNPDRSLEINIHCTAPQAIDLSHGTADLEQLVPDLGLNEIYPSVSGRKFPLFVSTPLFESTTFRIHLPDGVQIVRRPEDFHADGEFGSYSVTFREPRPGVLEIKRAFDVPVQVIEPGKLTAFANFEEQVARAERQRIGLAVDRTVARAGQ